jgi:hypothetical protein
MPKHVSTCLYMFFNSYELRLYLSLLQGHLEVFTMACAHVSLLPRYKMILLQVFHLCDLLYLLII